MIHIEGFPSELKKPCVLFDNIFEQGAVTFSSNAATGPNAYDGNTYDFWEPNSTTARIEVVLDAAKAVDCFCLTSHTAGSSGNRIQVEFYRDASWVTVATIFPTTDEAIMAVFQPVEAEQWRVRFIDGAPPVIGVISLGKRLVFAMGIVGEYTPTNWGKTVEVLGGDTMGGQFVGQRVIRRGGTTAVSLGYLDRCWFETCAEPFITHYDEAKPFFYCGGPRVVPKDLAYCWRPERSSEIRPRYVEAGLYVRMSFEVAFHVAA